MSVKVNLLPQESKRDAQQSQQRAIAAGVFVLFLAGLGGIYLWQQGNIDDANETLAAEQTELQVLQSEEQDLAPYAELQAQAQAATDTLQAALGGERSAAGLMQDLALVFPPDAEANSINLSFQDVATTPSLGFQRPVYGNVNIVGQVRQGLAPGVEGFLLNLAKLGVLDVPSLQSATIDEDEVTSFTITSNLGPEILTGRYTDVDLEDLR